MLQNNDAERFDWYLPVTNGESSSASAPNSASASTERLRFDPARRVGGTTSVLPQLNTSVRVTIQGLQTSIDLNGKSGTCKKYVAETGRWEVKLDDRDETLALLPKNLQPLAGS